MGLLQGVLDPPAWSEGAACASESPELFFPFPGEEDQIAAAQEVCARCPVVLACREHALAVREPYGVWGGLTEADRKRANRWSTRQRRKAALTPGGGAL